MPAFGIDLRMCIERRALAAKISTWLCRAQALSVIATGGSALTLTEWIIVFMVFNLIIAQYPHMHSLRFVNSAATFSTISFSAIAVGLSLYSGALPGRPGTRHPSARGLTLLSTAQSSGAMRGEILFHFAPHPSARWPGRAPWRRSAVLVVAYP